MCNKQKIYIEKTIIDSTEGFKIRTKQHTSDCKKEVSRCTFLRHVYDCGIKNDSLEELFLSLISCYD